jgi:di/tricarboxylate transporter
MTLEAGILLALLVAAFVAFFREIFPVEVTALGLLAALVAIGLVPPQQAFTGFSNSAVITIGALFVLAEALTRTGLLELASDSLGQGLSARKGLAVAGLLVVASLTSGILNNTAVVAMFIPVAVTLCKRLGLSPSRVLLPLSYAAIFGGTLTLIGTSTNVLVSSLLVEAGQPAIAMFELTRAGMVFVVVGLAYVLLFSARLLPDTGTSSTLTRRYGLGPYLTEVRVEPTSKLVGRTLREAEINARYGVLVLELLRDGERRVEGIEDLALQASDHLLAEGGVDDLMRLRREQGLALLPDIKLTDKELDAGGLTLVEGIVAPTSAIVGRSLQQIDFRHQYGGFVLAIRRLGSTLRSKIGHVQLHASDSLLLLVPETRLDELRRSDDLIIASESEVTLRRERFWWLVFVLLPAVIALAAFGAVDIGVGAPIAAITLLVFRVLTPQQAYRSINWTVLFLIAAFIPVGHAIVATGLADLLASGLVGAGGLVPPAATPYVVLSLLYLATSLLTEVLSNSAAAVILVPVALSLGSALAIDPRPFVIAVCFAASAAFITPMGYQTNLMVYGPGGYRFLDYTRFGLPLNLLFWILATGLIPWFWPF